MANTLFPTRDQCDLVPWGLRVRSPRQLSQRLAKSETQATACGQCVSPKSEVTGGRTSGEKSEDRHVGNQGALGGWEENRLPDPGCVHHGPGGGGGEEREEPARQPVRLVRGTETEREAARAGVGLCLSLQAWASGWVCALVLTFPRCLRDGASYLASQ